MIYSMALDVGHKREIGRKFSTELRFDFLGIGVTIDCFQMSGRVPVIIAWLKMRESGLARESAQFLIKMAGMPSGEALLAGLRDMRAL